MVNGSDSATDQATVGCNCSPGDCGQCGTNCLTCWIPPAFPLASSALISKAQPYTAPVFTSVMSYAEATSSSAM
jgi:hypothetical protein